MRLFHVSFLKDNLLKQFTPRVPDSAGATEDKVTERICFADSIEGCLTAMPSNYRHDYLAKGALITVWTIDTERLPEGSLVTPSELTYSNKVPDALDNGEYWVTIPLKLNGKRFRIIDYSYEFSVNYNALDLQSITDTAYECLPNRFRDEFMNSFDRATCSNKEVCNRFYEITNRESLFNEEDDFWDSIVAMDWAQGFKFTRLELEEVVDLKGVSSFD